MNQQISYVVRRNVEATDKDGRPTRIALALIRFPNGDATTLAIPEGLLATIPPGAVEDFIEQEVQAAVGYEVTRQ